MRDFEFYEFAGILLPGICLLVGLGLLFGGQPASSFLLPTNFGGALANLAVAYALGHLLAGLANMLESLYWFAWGGMPTDWPYSRPRRSSNADTRARITARFSEGQAVDSMAVWRQLVRRAQAQLYSTDNSSRLQTFNGTYGLSRGLLVVSIILLAVAWDSDLPVRMIYPVLAATAALALFRMHRFALRYADELFSAATLAPRSS